MWPRHRSPVSLVLPERDLDEENHIHVRLLLDRIVALPVRLLTRPDVPMRSIEVALPLPGKARPHAVLVVEQSLPPNRALGKSVSLVVDNGDAGALPGSKNGEHCRISAHGLVVEEHRIEGRLSAPRNGKETGLRARQNMGVSVR